MFAAAAFGIAAAAYLFIVMLDPYGLRTAPGRAPTPIMDLNQRFMYPQVVRSGRYDAAIFGTSTIRLLDPLRLGQAFEARFANLGLNAGTPWEQVQLASLFLRHVPAPKALVFGIDMTWCEADADTERKRLTPRAFPPWLYDDDPLDDYPKLLNARSLEIAGRVLLNRLGLMPERIRGDGYEIFVPAEVRYDLGRARLHIWGVGGPHPITPEESPAVLKETERAAMAMPALAWLDDLLGRTPSRTMRILLFTPVHVAFLPRPGSLEAARDAECKRRVADIARRRGATLVDFRNPSPVTTEDSNFWDPLHYRIGVAKRLVGALKQARDSGRDAEDGFYRVLARPALN